MSRGTILLAPARRAVVGLASKAKRVGTGRKRGKRRSRKRRKGFARRKSDNVEVSFASIGPHSETGVDAESIASYDVRGVREPGTRLSFAVRLIEKIKRVSRMPPSPKVARDAETNLDITQVARRTRFPGTPELPIQDPTTI